jgi:hypothetical protein
MSNQLESALIIQLASGSIEWGAALPPVNEITGTLTGINPGTPLDITQYARRDREFQHRDAINAAAIVTVGIRAQTVWNGSVMMPILQGVTDATGPTGTSPQQYLDVTAVGTNIPNSSTAVNYVLNADIPYKAVTVTDINLYDRDLLIYESLARAAQLFSDNPPISRIDTAGAYIGATTVWATAQGTNRLSVPNMAQPMNLKTFLDPDLYLADRDNRVAMYTANLIQALNNPFTYASRLYIGVSGSASSDSRENEAYVLTNNIFVTGNTYSGSEQVAYKGTFYQALNTTTDTPPSSNWVGIVAPTQLNFLAEPALDSRNRIIYDTQAKTLQWVTENPLQIHVPQIAGFFIPGIFPDQTIQTVPFVPERKDAEFYRLKAARMGISASGTLESEALFDPTGNRVPGMTYITGAVSTVFNGNKNATLSIPDSVTFNFQNIICLAGTYILKSLVRPVPEITLAGGDNVQGSVDNTDGGTTYSGIGDIRNWQIGLPAGAWSLIVDFENYSATPTSSFGIQVSQGATTVLGNTLPLSYTDMSGNPLPQFSVVSSPPISIQSQGQVYNFAVQWTSGTGILHVKQIRFQQVNGPSNGHYIMQASWLNSLGTNAPQTIVQGNTGSGGIPSSDGGIVFQIQPIIWNFALPAGNYQMYIDYYNSQATPVGSFPINIFLSNNTVQPIFLPYTNSSNAPLAQGTVVRSQAIGVISTGAGVTITIQSLVSGLDIKDFAFTQLNVSNSVSNLDVLGQANTPDVMPFYFILVGTDQAPSITVSWMPKSGVNWQAQAYNTGDQVLYNLIYWQAIAPTTPSDVPGQSPLWTQVASEPQIPLMFEQVQLLKWVATTITPDIVGFQGFRQDMSDRAIRTVEDAYTSALNQVGTNWPEFRGTDDNWIPASTEAWMSFIEVYQPRLRESGTTIPSGNIGVGRQYEAITQVNEFVIYNSGTYESGKRFFGVQGVTTYGTNGYPIIRQVGAYRVSRPGDLGNTGLVPSGLEYVASSGTGTVHGWYPSYASYPTHQAIQPWMIEAGIYTTGADFDSPDGNVNPPGAAFNPPVPHNIPNPIPPFMPSYWLVYIPLSSNNQIPTPAGDACVNGNLAIACDDDNFYSSLTGGPGGWVTKGNVGAAVVSSVVFGGGQYVAVGFHNIWTSPDLNTWTARNPSLPIFGPNGQFYNARYGGGYYTALLSNGNSTYAYSTDGISWSLPASAPPTIYGMEYVNGLWWVLAQDGGGHPILWNGATPVSTSLVFQFPASSNVPFHLAFGNGIYVAACNFGFIATSTDGINWTMTQIGTSVNRQSHIAFGNGYFVMFTSDLSIWVSLDGINWTNTGLIITPGYDVKYWQNGTFIVIQ